MTHGHILCGTNNLQNFDNSHVPGCPLCCQYLVTGKTFVIIRMFLAVLGVASAMLGFTRDSFSALATGDS